MAKYLISVLALNRVEGTKRCIEAVLKNSDEFELVLTNQASTDGTREYFDGLLKKHSNVTVFHEKENTGFIPPNERAFGLASKWGCKYFIALNDDTVPPPNWLTILSAPMEIDPLCVITGPASGCYTILDTFHGACGERREYVEGSCMMVRVSEVMHRLGRLYDPHLDFIYGDDSDLSLTVQRLGYRIAHVNMPLEHIRGATVMKNPKVKERCTAAQAMNHEYLKRKWAHYLRVRSFAARIVVRRWHALGDVILTTPVIRELKRQHPRSDIIVETLFPDVFQNNPYVTSASSSVARQSYDRVIDLDMVSENGVLRHFVKSYAREAGVEVADTSTDLFVTERATVPKKSIAIHMGPTWKSKMWPVASWRELVYELKKFSDFEVIAAGVDKSPVDIGQVIDLRNKTPSLQSVAATIAGCKLFIGVDSGLLHVAQAVKVPVVGIFGITESRYILTDGSPSIGVDADPSKNSRAGERHRIAGQSYIEENGETMASISVERVSEAVFSLLK